MQALGKKVISHQCPVRIVPGHRAKATSVDIDMEPGSSWWPRISASAEYRRAQKIFTNRLICFNDLFFIIIEYELVIVTRKKDLLSFAHGKGLVDTKKTLK